MNINSHQQNLCYTNALCYILYSILLYWNISFDDMTHTMIIDLHQSYMFSYSLTFKKPNDLELLQLRFALNRNSGPLKPINDIELPFFCDHNDKIMAKNVKNSGHFQYGCQIWPWPLKHTSIWFFRPLIG